MRIERGPAWLIVQLDPTDEPYDNMAEAKAAAEWRVALES